MTDFRRIVNDIELQKNKRLSGEFNCIPWGFKRFEQEHPGLEQGKYTIITANSKVGKCFGKGTQIRMFDGSVKSVEDIKEGDLLMGLDSKSRNVSGVTFGKEKMYKITSKYCDDLIVNESHILYLERNIPGNWSTYKGKKTSTRQTKKENIIITVKEYKNLSNTLQNQFRIKQARIDYPTKEVDIDPYFYGLWLGDGNTANPTITTTDQEIIDFLYDFSNVENLAIRKLDIRYSLSNHKRTGCFRKKLLSKGKERIDKSYLINSIEIREKLLAGIIDSDGYKVKNATYEITSKNESFIKDCLELIRSLGLSAYFFSKLNKKYNRKYYTVRFKYPNAKFIKVERKKNNYISNRNDRTFKIQELKEDYYYGFVVDKDHLFVLKDYSIVHNTQLADQLFLYNPYDFIKKEKTNISLKIFYFSLEMSKEEKIRQAICRKLFIDTNGKLVLDNKMLTSKYRNYILPDDVLSLIKQTEAYFDEFLDTVTFIDNIRNPFGIYSFVRDYAASAGKQFTKKVKFDSKLENGDVVTIEKEIDDYYLPYNKDEYVIIIVDHARLLQPEKGKTLHETIGDLSSNYFLKIRDKWNYSPVLIAQQAAAQESLDNAKFGRLHPTLDGIGTNKEIQQDANLILGLFSPFRHNLPFYPGKSSKDGYDINKFKDHIRFMEILGGRDGGAGTIVPLLFHGAVNWFTEAPSLSDSHGIKNAENLAISWQKN